MQREQVITAGITNIPLTKPAKLYFLLDMNDTEKINTVYSIFENLNIRAKRIDNNYTQKVYLTTLNEIDSKTIKMIFKNFRTLRPKLNSIWRYLFWEIDNQEETTLQDVVEVYRFMRLPVYVHKTMRGYHFISVKPICEVVMNLAISYVRNTNIKYPPLTLRIKPNKYPNEDKVWHEGFIISDVFHKDTQYLRNWIVEQDFTKIQEHYQLVWYPIPDQDKLESMSYEDRLKFELEQIENERELNK